MPRWKEVCKLHNFLCEHVFVPKLQFCQHRVATALSTTLVEDENTHRGSDSWYKSQQQNTWKAQRGRIATHR